MSSVSSEQILRDYMAERPHLTKQPFLASMRQRVTSTFRQVKRMTVDECADTIRKLPSTNAISGQWMTSTKEVGRGPMRAVTERGVSVITAMACTQLFKTALLENVVLYFTVVDPSPMIIVEPNKSMAEDLYHNKVKPMLDLTSPMKRRVRKARVGRIEFDGGFLKFANARSTVNIAMNAVRVVMSDETDKAPVDKVHGDPVDNAEKRNSTFGRRKLALRVCSPSTEAGRIYQSYRDSDQRRPFVLCPHCGHDHVMRWRKWTPELSEGQPYDFNTVEAWQSFSVRARMEARDDGRDHHVHDEFGRALYQYHCPSCDGAWTDFDHHMALRNIVWRQTKSFTCCNREQHPEIERSWDYEDGKGNPVDLDMVRRVPFAMGYATCGDCGRRRIPRKHAGFWANRFYDPAGSATSIQETFLGCQASSGLRKSLKEFVNSDMAEVFIEQAALKTTANALSYREEQYDSPMPRRAVVITAGIDRQKDRLAIGIYAHGRNGEVWLLRHFEIPGDPTKQQVWNELDVVLKSGFRRSNGQMERIKAACVDIGGDAAGRPMAIRFASDRPAVFAIQGKPEGGTSNQAPVWPDHARLGKTFYEVGTHSAKDMIDRMLRVTQPGPFCLHFPVGQDGEYYEQLLSERKQSRSNSPHLWWDKVRDRNEALDCLVYAIAARFAMEAPWGKDSGTRVEEWADATGIPLDILPEERPVPVKERAMALASVAGSEGAVLAPLPPEQPPEAPVQFVAARRPGGGRKR